MLRIKRKAAELSISILTVEMTEKRKRFWAALKAGTTSIYGKSTAGIAAFKWKLQAPC